MTARALTTLLALALLPAAFLARAQSNALPMPLESEDPDKPLVIVADQTWTGPEIQIQSKDMRGLGVLEFRHDASKGPVTLVIDYAATRPDSDADSEALIDIGIECHETPQPCKIPVHLGVVSIRSAYMGESVANVGAAPEAVWVGREGHTYTFADGAMVSVSLDLQDRRNLEPKAIRARLFYGEHDRRALPGQATRFGILMKIALAVGLLFALFLWWMRRG
ncbi:MAG: hypothetical protein KF800_02290 [Lysobacter sp.]|nr:hypothetical protein [Lysobacter sp.]